MKHSTMKLTLPMVCTVLACLACSSEPSCVNDSDCSEPERDSSSNESASEVEVTYLGATTDEALAHFKDAKVEVSDEHGLVLDSPTKQTLPQGSPATFTFHAQGTEGRLRTPAVPSQKIEAPFSRWLMRAGRELTALVGPVRVAHAHGTPFNGNAFFLRFHDAKGTLIANVFTDSGTYTPNAASWKTLGEAKQPLTLQVEWAEFEENEVVQGGGPFAGLEFEFSIE